MLRIRSKTDSRGLEPTLADSDKRFDGGLIRHLSDGVDDQLGFVEMNPVCAGRRDDLLYVVADFAEAIF